MERGNATVSRTLTGRTVQLVFAFLLGVWLILATGWLPDSLYAPLSPVWLPSYLAFAVASSVRSAIPWLGSELLFGVVIVLFTYVEAALLAGLFRFLRTIYQQYRGKQGASS